MKRHLVHRLGLGHKLAVVLAVFCGTWVAVSCVTTEETNRRRLAPLPDAYMNQLGLSAYTELKASEPIERSNELNQMLRTVAIRVADASGKKFDWDFTLFNSKEVNAFCLPGGKVGVYTGILPVAKTNAGLAAILGHEIGHAVARHSGERMSQEILVSGVLVSVQKLLGDSQTKPYVMAALGLGAKFGVVLPYSRAQETEADTIGLKYMVRAGYDPNEAVTLWERMAALGGAPPEMLSSHPDPLRRAAALRAEIPRVLDENSTKNRVSTEIIRL
ncbi:MAG: M48 family metallopeptidase [Deltaproteobacteria bacterium]|nr:M48 family metallopeptidase [Deltaproteobacteria bacterium]